MSFVQLTVVQPPLQAKFTAGGNDRWADCLEPSLPCKDARGRWAVRSEFPNVVMAREPKIAYVMLRNAHFGPRLAASVELCVRDLVVHSRYARSTLVVCPPLDQPFEDIEIATIPDAPISGNLGKAWGVAQLLRRRGIDLAIVENHLHAATFIALTSGVRVILHTHAYVKAPTSTLDGAFRREEMRRLSGCAFVSEYALSQFRTDFPGLRPLQRAVPNGLDMQAWSATKPKDMSILCVGRALGHKGHIEAMAAITRVLPSRPDWSARFMLSDPAAADREPETVEALRAAAEPFNGRIKVDSNVPYTEVKAAWERAEVGMVLTTGPEPFGRTALEAMASGAAVITSGRGGLAEICGQCALIVEPSDAKGIAAALGRLLDEPERRAGLAVAGRKRVEALFDIRAIARQMDEFIEACLGKGHGQVSDPGRPAVLPLEL
jgi:glycosyltransferase involved in cell wall biosynthesis